MSEVGAYEAKTTLSRLLARVKKGERFVITVHGHPVAELVPLSTTDRESARRAVDRVDAVRARLTKNGVRMKRVLRRGESLRSLVHSRHRV